MLATVALAGYASNKAARETCLKTRDFLTKAYAGGHYVYSKGWPTRSYISIRGGPTIHQMANGSQVMEDLPLTAVEVTKDYIR